MAVMDAALFQALWRHTAQTKYENHIIKGFQEMFTTDFYILSQSVLFW